jgi:peptidoglycan/LPS O-acetylase OafA/YrhL
MDKTTSLYLDVLRFSAAILVLLSHSATFLDIYLPVLSDFGSEAVAVFFVLSGYVISYVVAKKKIIPHLTLKQELLESILYLFQH